MLMGCIASAFLESGLFSKYVYTPTNLTDGEDEEDFPVLLQVSLHALLECLGMFQVGSSMVSGSGLQRAAEVQRNAFHIRGTLRLVYQGDGEPFLVMYPAPYNLRQRVTDMINVMIVQRRTAL
jgi:hypothetical protein